MKKQLVLYLVICVLISSCAPKSIDIDVAPGESKIVVSSHIIPYQYMFIALTKSYSALTPLTTNDTVSSSVLNQFLVTNALVTVAYSNQIDTLQMLTPGIYYSTNILLTNYNTYTLHVKEPSTGQEVTAVTTMLPQVMFDTIYPVVAKNPGDTLVTMKYVLQDNPNEENFYVINYILKQSAGGANLDINPYFGKGSNKLLSNYELLNDASFTNNTLYGETALAGVKATDSIAVEMANISKGYYDFLTAAKRRGEIVTQLTSEPIHFPTNVQNGYGYFNAFFPEGKVFYLGEY